MIELLGYLLILVIWGEGFKMFFLEDFKRTWEFTKESSAWTDRGLGVFLLLAMLAYPIVFVVVVIGALLLGGHGTFVEGCKKVWGTK